MNKFNPHIVLGLFILLFVVGISVHLTQGAMGLSLSDFGALQRGDAKHTVLVDFRLPKILGTLLGGAAISVAGLLMQTFFRNPLAGPFVLGISSGASLGVALYLLGSASFAGLAVMGNLGLIGSAFLGSMAVLGVILFTAKKIQQSSHLLIVGLMWASLTAASVSILEYFAAGDQIKFFLIWNMGSFLSLTLADLAIFAPVLLASLVGTVLIAKTLNVMLLGPAYAKTMGINYHRASTVVLLLTCALTATTTAYVGPLAFVGLAVPHFCKQWLQSRNHSRLIVYCALCGSVFMLWCQLAAEHILPNDVLPINIITSAVGAPLVIRILLKRTQE